VCGRPEAWQAFLQSLKKLGLALSLTGALWGAGALPGEAAWAKPPSYHGIPTVALTELPAQVQVADRLIHAGGPFPHAKDGVIFGNREHLLPVKPRGHYREYTVQTPGAHDRGPSRIVCGGREPTRPEVCYFTGDHYMSFKQIVE